MSLYKGLVLFTLPMYYAFHTRYQGMTGVFAWLVKYFLPCFFVAFASDTFSWSLFALGLIYVYQFYELGYIQNDCETIKRETAPTMRLTPDELMSYERHKCLFLLVRIIETAVVGVCLYVMGLKLSLLLFFALTLPVFVLYNTVRNGFCLVIHLVLMMMRYTAPVFISANSLSLWPAVFLFFAYPVTLFVECSVKGKFGYKSTLLARFVLPSYEGRYLFRIKYYSVFVILLLIATFTGVASVLYVIPVAGLLMSSVMTYRNANLQYNK